MKANAAVSNKGRYPSFTSYTCQVGYSLKQPVTKSQSVTCQVNGTWTGSLPVCEGIPCSILAINNGSVQPADIIRYPDEAGIFRNVVFHLRIRKY